LIIKLNPQKERADSCILASIVVIFIILVVFFRLVALMSIIVFPLSSLFLYSSYCLVHGLFKRRINSSFRIKNILYGIFGIPFSVFFLVIIFSQANITRAYVIYFLAIAIIIIGFAGIIKSILITIYKKQLRIINIIIGYFTIVFSIIVCIYAVTLFFYIIIGFSIVLILNAVYRAAMYLSEYHLSLKHLKNKAIIKFLFEIISEVPIVEIEDESSEYIEM
jgi:hypothetical protein